MILIILTGAPASGKSSFALPLAKTFGIPWVSKDAYKIQLFERYGFNSHAEKKKLSIRGEAMLNERIEQALAQDESLIVDNNFKNFSTVKDILECSGSKCKVICFYLYADSSILAKRYNERILSGQRERSLYTLNVYPVIEGISEFHRPLTSEQVDDIQSNVSEETFGDIVVRINTNSLDKDFDMILQQMTEIISENIKKA